MSLEYLLFLDTHHKHCRQRTLQNFLTALETVVRPGAFQPVDEPLFPGVKSQEDKIFQ